MSEGTVKERQKAIKGGGTSGTTRISGAREIKIGTAMGKQVKQ